MFGMLLSCYVFILAEVEQSKCSHKSLSFNGSIDIEQVDPFSIRWERNKIDVFLTHTKKEGGGGVAKLSMCEGVRSGLDLARRV